MDRRDIVVRKERKRGTNGEPITVQLPPLLDEATFEQVQRKLGAASFGRRTLPDRFYSMSGFLWSPWSQELAGANRFR